MEDVKGVVRLGMPYDERPQPVQFLSFLTNHCKLWRDIGLLLGLKPSVLDQIEHDNRSQRDCFRVTLEKWLELDNKATWGCLELAITNANRLSLGYESLSSLTMTTATEKPPELVKQFRDVTVYLKKKFVEVILKIQCVVKKAQVDVKNVITVLCFADDDKCTVFSTDDAFKTITTVKELLHCIARYCTIYDYAVLDVFVQATECQDAIDELNKFTNLLQNHVLKEVDLLTEFEELQNPDDFMQGTYKFVVEYVGGTGTLKVQKMIQNIIQERVHLKRGTLVFKGFAAGSVLFIYQVSEAVKLHLLRYKFTEQDIVQFAALSIKKLTVDGIVIMTSHEILEDIQLQQVCSEKDLASIAKERIEWERVYMHLDVTEAEAATIMANHPHDYGMQILKKWKTKKGEFQGTFKVLSEIFVKRGDQRMIGVIKTVAAEAYEESSENSVIELIDEFKAVNFEVLRAVAQQFGLFTPTHLETFEDAPNNVKKFEIILTALMNMLKPQLIHFIRSLATQRESVPMLMSKPVYNDDEHIEKAFRSTVKNIKKHLKHCDIQDLVTDFNNVLHEDKFPNVKNRVKEKLCRCRNVGDLFTRISPFFSWKKRKVLRALVQVSDCQEAIDKLNKFEAQLNYNQPAIYLPIASPSSDILPDPGSDVSIITAKFIQDLKKSNLRDIDRMEDTIARTGRINKENLDLQAQNHGSSILYWLIPRDMVKSFEDNIRDHLDDLYEQGIVEISLDPNIVITTGHKLRVRSLSYLTKLPPPDAVPVQRTEELQELPAPDTKLPERTEEIMELAYQLKIDMRKRMEEIKELDSEVKHKEQECNQLKEKLVETVQENEELKHIVQVSTQPSREDTVQEATHGVHSAQYVNLSFGVRGHTAVYCGGKVYIGGGVVSKHNGAPNIIQVVDVSAQRVSHLPPCPLKHFTLVSIDNQIVTVGGKTTLDDQITNKLYCWREATQQWEERFPPMPTPRQFHTSVVWNNYLIVCGGRIDTDDTITDNVEMLNLQTKRWHSASSLPLKESGKHAVITDSGKLYLLGGQLGNAVHYCELQKLVASIVTASGQPREALVVWRRLEDTPSTDCAAVLLRGSLVLIGGRSYETNKISSRILRYSNADGEWQHIGDLLVGRTACMAVALDNNTVLVTGGTVFHANQRPDWFSASTEIVTAN